MATKQIFNDLNLVIRLNQHIEDIANSDEATTALLSKQTSFKVLAELDALKNPDPREEAQFDHQRSSFRDEDTAQQQLPFHLQGDQEFNKARAIAERCALRRSDPIKRKIAFLWDVAHGKQKAEMSRTASAERHLLAVKTAASGFNSIDERAYTDLMLLIFKVLREDFVLDLAKLQVHCDWEVDSHHGDALSFEQFFAAMFELVDLWTCDIMESTYVRFLELLARRITLRVIMFLDDMKLKLALSDNFDDAVVVKAIPLSTIPKFASVAKVVERNGVRTVGDLANADPQMVERERLAYVEKKNFSKEKIGAKLQHLLDTFNGLSQQFELSGRRYSFEHRTSVHHHSIAEERSMPNEDASAKQLGGANGLAEGSDPFERSGTRNYPSSHPGSEGGAIGSNTLFETPGQHSLASPISSGCGSAHSQHGSATPGRNSFEFPNDSAHSQSSMGALLKRSATTTRRLSIHDLSTAESEIINSLRSAFLIEKGISIHRKHDIESVRKELEKFGVDPTGLSDLDALEKYGELYEMFVLRDGESIKSLAQTMLAQIKLELKAHGIIVKDEDVEVMYDGFYGSVVATTGEDIVNDAKNWMDETVKTNTVSSYVKADYRELKPLDDVALIGSQAGDEEFVSLLSSDGDEEDDPVQPVAEDRKPKHVSPIQRKRSQLKTVKASSPSEQPTVRSPVERDSELSKLKPSTPPRSSSSSPRRRSGPRVDSKVDQPQRMHLGDKKKKSKGHAKHDDAPMVHPAPSPSSPPEDPKEDRAAALSETLDPFAKEGDDHESELDGSNQAQPTLAAADAETESEHAHDKEELTAVESVSIAPPPIQQDAGGGRRPSGSLKTVKSKSDLNLEFPLEDLNGSDTITDDIDREAQGIEFEYESARPPAAEPIPVQERGIGISDGCIPPTCPHDDRIVELVPKIPKIIIGTGADGANIPVAARYIQLLGLGTVLTASDEAGLYQLLASEEGADADLVCLDMGAQLHVAVEKLLALQNVVGKRVIILGGDVDDPEQTSVVADECLALGAIFFATLPLNFPELRTVILAFFENSAQPYILRQRKPTGRATTALKMASRSIEAASLFGLHDNPRKVSTPPSYANSARQPKRKPTTTLPALPTIVKEVTTLIQPKSLDELRSSEVLPITPMVPRSLKSYKKSSPRLSIALKKMMR